MSRSSSKSFVRPVTIESLEGRQLLSAVVPGVQAATADAGSTPDTAVDLGTISKKKTISKQQTIGGSDTTDVYTFKTTKAMEVELKLSGNSAKPKLSLENSALEDAFTGKKSSKVRVGDGTFYVTVTSSATKSGKYKLEVKAKTTSKSPTFQDPGQSGGTVSGTVKPIAIGDPNADIQDPIDQITFVASQTGSYNLPVTLTGAKTVVFQVVPFDQANNPNAGGGGASGVDFENGVGVIPVTTQAGVKYYLNVIVGDDGSGANLPASYTIGFDPTFNKVTKENV